MSARLVRILGCVLALAACALVFARTMDRDLNHDEHQFLAPAALLSREGLQPWRDYALFHLPNLIFAYAAAERITGDVLLGAKLICFTATAFVIALIVWLAVRNGTRSGLAIACAVVLLLLGDPLFRLTAGKTWNHEVPTALLIASGALLVIASKRDRLWQTAIAGMLAGLAAGCRLTFAPTLVGLFVFTLLMPMPWRRRFMHATVLTCAATIALGPSLYYLATQTEPFLFANFEFPRLRLADPANTRIQKTVVLWRKVRFFLKEIIRPSWAVFLIWGAIVIRPGWRWIRTRQPGQAAAGLCMLLVPFVVAGCFAPSRYQAQHFFVLIPMMTTAIAVVITTQCTTHKRVATLAILLAGVISMGGAATDFAAIRDIAQPREWYPSKLQRMGMEIRNHVPDGMVLTLGPTFPLAGGLGVYPEFATGTFGWRSASLVPAERRRRLRLIAPEDCDELLRDRPPAAVLTGVEEDAEEAPLIEWAQRHGFRSVALRKKRVLWLPAGHP